MATSQFALSQFDPEMRFAVTLWGPSLSAMFQNLIIGTEETSSTRR
jgi:hypothetical protein